MGGTKIGIGFGLWELGMPDPDTIFNYAVSAEAVGIDSIWLSDHVVSRNPSLDTSCVMAAWSARTTKIKMGPSVLTLPARDPVQVAKTYATLDYISGGKNRVIMAVGIGANPKDCLASGIDPSERARRMEEGVQVMRKLWAEPHASFEGQYYHFEDVTIEPRPKKGTLDVWIGGKTDQALKRTARYGDGWFPSFVSPDEFHTGMDKLRAYGEQYGREIDPREAGVLILSCVDPDRKRAQDIAGRFLQGFPLPQEALVARCAIGTPEECIDKVQSYVDIGCSKFVLWPIVPPNELIPQIELYGTAIIPHFT